MSWLGYCSKGLSNNSSLTENWLSKVNLRLVSYYNTKKPKDIGMQRFAKDDLPSR